MVRPQLLAQNYVVVGESPDLQNVFLGSPALARHPSQRLIATYEYFTQNELRKVHPDNCFIMTSDDDGATWAHRANLTIKWPTPFAAGDTLYLVGVVPYGHLAIR